MAFLRNRLKDLFFKLNGNFKKLVQYTEMLFEAKTQKLVQSILVTVFAILCYNVKIENTSFEQQISRFNIQRCQHSSQIHRRLQKYVFGGKCFTWLVTADNTANSFTQSTQPRYCLLGRNIGTTGE